MSVYHTLTFGLTKVGGLLRPARKATISRRASKLASFRASEVIGHANVPRDVYVVMLSTIKLAHRRRADWKSERRLEGAQADASTHVVDNVAGAAS